jgi:hypothetical protein
MENRNQWLSWFPTSWISRLWLPHSPDPEPTSNRDPVSNQTSRISFPLIRNPRICKSMESKSPTIKSISLWKRIIDCPLASNSMTSRRGLGLKILRALKTRGQGPSPPCRHPSKMKLKRMLISWGHHPTHWWRSGDWIWSRKLGATGRHLLRCRVYSRVLII